MKTINDYWKEFEEHAQFEGKIMSEITPKLIFFAGATALQDSLDHLSLKKYSKEELGKIITAIHKELEKFAEEEAQNLFNKINSDTSTRH